VAWLALREATQPGAGGAQDLLAALAAEAALEPRDRGLAFEIMQGVWRHRRLLDLALARLEGFEKAAPAPEVADLLRIGAVQHFLLDRLPPHAVVHETVAVAGRHLGPHRVGFVNAAMQRLLAQYPGRTADWAALAEGQSPEVRYSLPGWIVRLLKREMGADGLSAACEAINRPLPLYVRANPPFASPADVLAGLTAEGVVARLRPDLAPWCLEVEAPVGVLIETRPFRDGEILIQDASAQIVAAFAGARPGQTVVDYCAAPGGKTTALVSAMHGQGRLLACDTSADRILRLEENLMRLGVGGFVGVRQLADSDGDPEALLRLPVLAGGAVGTDGVGRAAGAGEAGGTGGADLVLVDAPCSGLGTLRRHPEIRWRLARADLERLAARQGTILDRAARLVRPGGRLVYATCSVASEENRQVVAAFLERQTGAFEVEIGTLAEGVPERLVEPDGWLRTLPGRDETDSVGAVRLRRKA
jgi:16S rRNA (cytosine967-C5)-methyltransferase